MDFVENWEDWQEDKWNRALERAELAESKLKDVETELETVGENITQSKLKAEVCYEYGEMYITKVNICVDDIEDKVCMEKYNIKKVNDELNDTFDEMLTNY